MPAMTAVQRAALQYISDNSPTRQQLSEACAPAWEFRVLPLKMWLYATYDPATKLWTITAAGTAALAA